jgi:hypothetical protein
VAEATIHFAIQVVEVTELIEKPGAGTDAEGKGPRGKC